jgi:hypothetical protein
MINIVGILNANTSAPTLLACDSTAGKISIRKKNNKKIRQNHHRQWKKRNKKTTLVDPNV